jgi:hypothetical protein
MMAVAATAMCISAVGQSTGKVVIAEDTAAFATNKCYGKAGLGIIDEYLYVKLWSETNEILYGKQEKWFGLKASTPEIAVAFEGKIWSIRNLPKAFDLSKAVVISFEGSKVRFFDFRRMAGGYYERKIGPEVQSQTVGIARDSQQKRP